MFNVFINDIFYFIHDSVLYNYADDNTLSYVYADCDQLETVLERDSEKLIDWFEFNCMKANPDKFQAICLGHKAASNIQYWNQMWGKCYSTWCQHWLSTEIWRPRVWYL